MLITRQLQFLQLFFIINLFIKPEDIQFIMIQNKEKQKIIYMFTWPK